MFALYANVFKQQHFSQLFPQNKCFVLEPAKHSRKLLPYIHHYYSATFKIFYWSHSLTDFHGLLYKATAQNAL